MFSLKSSLEEGEYSECLVLAEHASWSHGQIYLLLFNEWVLIKQWVSYFILHHQYFVFWEMVYSVLHWPSLTGNWVFNFVSSPFLKFFSFSFFHALPLSLLHPRFSPLLLFFILFISKVERTKARATCLKPLSQWQRKDNTGRVVWYCQRKHETYIIKGKAAEKPMAVSGGSCCGKLER